MPITNIVDSRKRKYRWKKITPIVEPTWHDNSCGDSDQAEVIDSWSMGYADKVEMTLAEAIQWANSFPGENTLFIYDRDVIFDEDGEYKTELDEHRNYIRNPENDLDLIEDINNRLGRKTLEEKNKTLEEIYEAQRILANRGRKDYSNQSE